MSRGLSSFFGLLAAVWQIILTAPALAQSFTVDIQPRSAQFAFGAPVVHYLRVAPKAASDTQQLRVCLRLAVTNTTALQLNNVTIAIASNQLVVPLSPAVAIPAGSNQAFWWNKFQGSSAPSQCLLIDTPAPPATAPNTGTLTLSFGGAPQTTTFALKAHDGPVYAFPGSRSDRRPGEFLQAYSVRHAAGAEGSQLFAYDMGVVGFDPTTKTWSECNPGILCDPENNSTLKNSDYRIWGTPIHAMANGTVVEFMNDVDNNTKLGAGKFNSGLCGVQGAGNHFYIDHGGETVLYAHMQKGSLNQKLTTVGAMVTKGEVLGLAGNAGTASNPHLHIHAMIGQPAIAPGKNVDGMDQTCMREVSPLILRPLPFSDAYALDRTMVDPVTFAGPWVKLDRMGPPSVTSLIFSTLEIVPIEVVELAIDPMALILPPKWYVFWVELRHPHEPKVAEVQQVLRLMTPEEQKAALDRARTLGNVGKAVEEAFATMQK